MDDRATILGMPKKTSPGKPPPRQQPVRRANFHDMRADELHEMSTYDFIVMKGELQAVQEEEDNDTHLAPPEPAPNVTEVNQTATKSVQAVHPANVRRLLQQHKKHRHRPPTIGAS